MTWKDLAAGAGPSCWRAAVLIPHAAAIGMLVVSHQRLVRHSKRLGKRENPFVSGTALHKMVENEYEAFHKSETAAVLDLMQTCRFGSFQMVATLLANIVILYSTARNAFRCALVYVAEAAGVGTLAGESAEHLLGNAIVLAVFFFTLYIMVFRVSFSWKVVPLLVICVGCHVFFAARGLFVCSDPGTGMYIRQYHVALILLVLSVGRDYIVPLSLVHTKRFDVGTLPDKMQKIVAEAGFQNRILDVSSDSSKVNAACFIVGFFKPICLIGNIAAKL